VGNTLLDKVYRLAVEADRVLEGVVHRTPTTYSHTFSSMCGVNVYLKLENLQKTGAFKLRGAYFKIYSFIEEARRKGVVTASSGNHAQGVAYSAGKLGVKATVVMPVTTPPYKVNATKYYGANVMLYGDIYDEAYAKALEISKEVGAVFIHPFNDVHVVAGQGTIAFEILREVGDVDYVLVPVGGGGLISGIGAVIKAIRGSRTKVIGVEPEVAPKLLRSLEAGEPVDIQLKPSLADGVLTKRVGDLTFDIMKEVVDDVVLVDEDSIARAIYLLLERAKLLAEGAGVLPLAALLSGALKVRGGRVVAVISGGNADLTTLYRVILRGLAVDNRIVRLTLVLRDVPGMLNEALKVVSANRLNILDIRHDRFDVTVPQGYARVELIAESPSPDVCSRTLKELRNRGFKVITNVGGLEGLKS